jgi:hypothetical protein
MIMAKGGLPPHPTDQLRLYIPYDAIAPGPNGDMPRTELLIWTKAGGEPDHILLPNNIMRAVWWDYLRWRGARLATRDRATSAAPARRILVRVPTPSDTGLKTALRREREGRDAAGTTITLERLAEPTLSTNDRRIALMSLANTFQADDDAPAAALVADELTSMDPCALTGSAGPANPNLSDDAYSGLRSAGALLDHTRPGVRCTAMRAGAVFLRGMLVPGYGQYTTWSHLLGLGGAALTLAGSVTAYGFLQSSKNSYAAYEVNRTGFAPYYYTNSARERGNALTVATASAVLWVGMALEAEIQERVHASRLAAVREFWIRPMLAPAGAPGSGAPGVMGGLAFSFK